MVVRGNKMTFRSPNEREPEMQVEFTGRPTAQPSPMNFRFLDNGNGGGTSSEEKNAKGLSRIEGDVWTLSLTRPEPFADQAPERWVLTRVGR